MVIRPIRDNRGYLTHSDTNDPLETLRKKFSKLKGHFCNEITDEVLEAVKSYDEVFVDEYFMIKNNKKLLELYGKTPVKNIYFAGLLASSENKLFDEAIEILPYCDKIRKLNGVCTKCGSEEGNFTTYQGATEKTGDILVGDADYTCHCFNCRGHE